MDMTDRPPWLQAPLQRAVAALATGRLAHGLLVCGAEHIGKRAFAAALAGAVLCRQRVDGTACGRCRDCVLVAAGTHPDLRTLSYAESEKTGVLRKEIVIEQVRELAAWLALTAQRGGALVAIIDPATAMNHHAANALLKALEEPLPGRYLLLLCVAPAQLPATIRSRCQRIVLQPPPTAEALAWLRRRGHAETTAAAALAAARGHPGLAAHWLDSGLIELRQGVHADLAAIAQGRSSPLEVAAQWLGDDRAGERLQFAAEHAVERAAVALAATAGAARSASGDADKLATWFAAANRTRELLRTPIRGDLALAGLLREWRLAMAG